VAQRSEESESEMVNGLYYGPWKVEDTCHGEDTTSATPSAEVFNLKWRRVSFNWRKDVLAILVCGVNLLNFHLQICLTLSYITLNFSLDRTDFLNDKQTFI